MKTIIWTEDEFLAGQKAPITEPLSVALGVFDGLHRGHQALLDQTLKSAKQTNGQSGIVAFDFSQVDFKKRDVHLLTANETESMLAAQGFAYYITIQFGEKLAAMQPAAFLAQLTKLLPIVAITVGTDFSFGKDRTGDVNLLAAYAEKLNYTLHLVPLVTQESMRISSSQIEQLLLAGEVAQANKLLGYTYALTGQVIHGEQKGQKIGYPTANMVIPAEKVFLPNGVYVTRVLLAEKLYDAATNIGVSPTMKTGALPIIETYIFDFSADIYNRELVVYFYERIRSEQKFDSIAALKEQMAKDITVSRQYLSNI